MPTAEVSHGRGGAGNINPDTAQYTDGEVVRVGVEGSHGDGAFSTGRGGVANIGDAGARPQSRKDIDLVPEVATRPSQEQGDYHVGRGGAGNERLAPGAEPAETGDGAAGSGDTPLGLADKLKSKIFGVFKK